MITDYLQKLVRVLGYEVLTRRDFGYRLEEHLIHVLDVSGADVVVDAGARHGGFGAALRKGGYKNPIYSFEPIADSFAILQESSRNDPVWNAYQVALGAEDATIEINRTASSDLASIRKPSGLGRATWADKAEIVAVEKAELRRLDTLLPELMPEKDRRRVFVKSDTQGWDLEVLNGAKGVLDSVVGLMIEIHFETTYEGAPGFVEEMRRLGELGFLPTGVFPIFRSSSGAIVEADCVCVRV